MSEITPTITKSTATVYRIRNLPRGGWANITIDAAEEHGRIQIASDYGDWQNFWSHCGGPFRDFLAQLEIGYVAGKFGADRWFDAEGTIRQFKVDVIEARKYSMSKETAAAIWKDIKSLDHALTETQFCIELSHCDALMDRYDGCPPLYHRIQPLFRRFWDEVWPVLLAEFKKEAEEQS